MKKIIGILSGLILILNACSSSPEEINYGDDKCNYCTMNIMDKPYATELVTDKGKVYKFDSTECMLNYMNEQAEMEMYDFILTNTMDKPGELIDAKICTFLISKNLPSPMGENITAFSSKEEAEKAQKEYDGVLLTFENLKTKKEGKKEKHHHH